MKQSGATLILIFLMGCGAQTQTRSLPPEETHHGLNLTTDDQGRTRMEEVHEYRLGGVEWKSRK
jgi:hypothetical protein